MACCSEQPTFTGQTLAYRRVLIAVITINALMFIVEMAGGVLAGSVALQADALDFAGDTLTYAISLWALGHSEVWRARVALVKGGTLGVMGLWVFGVTAYQVLVLGMPDPVVMGVIATLALGANVISALLLMRYRNGDANVRSVWLCSRNDAIGNVAVVAAAGLVAVLGSAWPDLVVATVMALLFLNSAAQIVRQALGELRAVPAGAD